MDKDNEHRATESGVREALQLSGELGCAVNFIVQSRSCAGYIRSVVSELRAARDYPLWAELRVLSHEQYAMDPTRYPEPCVYDHAITGHMCTDPRVLRGYSPFPSVKA